MIFLEQIAQLEGSDSGALRLFVRGFSPYKSIFTGFLRTEERQSVTSQKDLERRQVWIHVACQILSIVES